MTIKNNFRVSICSSACLYLIAVCMKLFLRETLTFEVECEEGWIPNVYSGTCIILVATKRDRTLTTDNCKSENSKTRLVTIRSKEENEFIYDLVKGMGPFWIGLTNSHAGYKWPSPSGYLNLANSTGEECFLINHDNSSKFTNIPCHETHGSICEKTEDESNPCPDSTPCFITASCLHITTFRYNYYTSRRTCEKVHGLMARVRDKRMNTFLSDLLKGYDRPFWFRYAEHDGARIQAGRDRHIYPDDNWFQRSNYSNWEVGHPQNITNDCYVINKDSSSKWETYNCNLLAGSVCETIDCPQKRFGFQCEQECPTGCQGMQAVCARDTGVCLGTCKSGWQYPGCTKPCRNGSWGENCLYGCSKCYQRDCDPIYGRCRSGCVPGFWGKACREGCPLHQTGRNCADRCSPGCAGTWRTCDKKDARCLEGCRLGFTGPKCLMVCARGHYGMNCSKNCSHNCLDEGEICDYANGNCLHGCVPGYYGKTCQQECKYGFWGRSCVNPCSPFCLHQSCLKTTGECLIGCPAGYQGLNCSQACRNNTYGMGCSSKCGVGCARGNSNYTCDHVTGKCLSGCVPGFYDEAKFCISEDHDFDPMYIAIIIPIIIVIVVLIICFILRASGPLKELRRLSYFHKSAPAEYSTYEVKAPSRRTRAQSTYVDGKKDVEVRKGQSTSLVFHADTNTESVTNSSPSIVSAHPSNLSKVSCCSSLSEKVQIKNTGP